MKRFYIFYFLLAFIFQTNAQVNVFDCSVYTKQLSQTELNASQQFNGTCISLGDNGAIHVQNSANKSIFASSSITLKDNVHLGEFDLTGGVHLKITSKTELNIAVMNYNDLYSVLRYKKLEFGIELPDNVLTRINYFLHNKGVHSDELNPFLEWNIDVEGVFQHVQTGKTVKVDGFYTREYTENPDTDDWDDTGTNFPFRIRFAPPENGEWKAYVTIRLKNGQELGYQSDNFMFNVVESGDPGYVKVHENKRNLKQGDRMIFPVGQNFPGPDFYASQWGSVGYLALPDGVHIVDTNKTPWDTIYYGHNLWSPTNTEKATNVYLWGYYLEMVSDYLNKGGKFIRTMQLPWSSLIEFEEKGNYYKRLHYAYEQDKLLDTLEKYDALMLFNMLYQTPLFRYDILDGWVWDWEGDTYSKNGQLETYSPDYPRYCYNDKPPHQKLPYEMFTDASDLAYHKQRMRYYIARYGYSTKIYEFELLSEPFHIGEQKEIISDSGVVTVPYRAPYKDTSDAEHALARNAIYNYHKVLSEYIKDSLQWHNQLIGVDMGYKDNPPLEAYDFRNSSLPNIDIASFNAYYANPDAVYEIESFVQDIWGDRGYDMPVLLSEVGTNPGYGECSNYTQQPVDMMSLGFTKVAGFYPWTGYSADFDWNYTHFWKHTIRAQYHMNGDDVIGTLSEGGGKWGHGKQESTLKKNKFGKTKTLVENQYYGGYNANTVVGYIKNRTYNIHTKGCNNVIFNNPPDYYLHHLTTISKNDVKATEKIKLLSLKNLTKYYVDWYSFKDGNFLKTDYIKTNFNGTLKLHFPTLSGDNPVVWYVVHQNAYSGMKQNETPYAVDRVNFNFQPIENDTTSNVFKNSIYPNPFNNKIVVNSLEDDVFIIISSTGNLLMTIDVHKGENSINVQNLPKGLYFAELKNQAFITKLERL